MATTVVGNSEENHERFKALKQFDDSKAGVKGLVDSGIDSIPPFFVHPPEFLDELKPAAHVPLESLPEIPVIDLSGVDSPERRSVIVEKICHASATIGFFQIINHGVPLEVQDRTTAAVKAFHEQPAEVKAPLYCREIKGVTLRSNMDLYRSKAASWRDTLMVRWSPTPLDPNEIPETCRHELVEWHHLIGELGELLLGLMSEGLGFHTDKFKEVSLLGERTMVGHYYPNCPQPDLTIGFTSHTDPGGLTVLLVQDQSGKLQVKYDEGWVDLKPLPGALIINIGDFFQIITNEEYKSVNHRVLANSSPEARISIATFFNPGKGEAIYGPLPELTSPEKPPLYRNFTWNEYIRRFLTNELDSKSLTGYFRKGNSKQEPIPLRINQV